MPSAMPCSDIASLFSAHHSALKVDYFCLLSLLPMPLKNTQRAGKTLSPSARSFSMWRFAAFLHSAVCTLSRLVIVIIC